MFELADLSQTQWLQGSAIVLLGLVEGAARCFVQCAQGGEFPVGDRAENDDTVFIADHGRGFNGTPRFFQLFQADLDDGDADCLTIVGQR